MRRFQVYDSMSRETRLFVPITPPKIGLFVCGLTPYDDAHIGHAKLAVTFDVVARALRRWGYRVFYVQNVTNLDDRLIARGAERGIDPLELAERYVDRWLDAMRVLGVASVNYYPHATDYVPEIIQQVQALIDRGFAYPSEGSVYYDVARFPAYGKLSGQRVDALRTGTRIEVDASKRSPEDFVLWKAATPGEPSWESPWGPGRPGWHIEDTAVTVRLLGPRYDIHGGGVELKFPHHEAEIAQAEAATGEAPLVRYWMHVGLLNMKGEKMSKSLGNVVGLSEMLDEFGPEVLRFYYLNAHYRSPLEYVHGKSLEESREAYKTLSGPARTLAEAIAASPESGGDELAEELANAATATVGRLDDLLADDFRTREAIAELFTWGKRVGPLVDGPTHYSRDALSSLDQPYAFGREVLGLFGTAPSASGPGPIVPVIEAFLAARARARARGDFAEADRIRADLAQAGVVLEDKSGTTTWRLDRGSPG
ncbi:MAG: cysteine--tRNA ligase [Thermoplasmata archaeon]|nr:cysteine--tRNA ligase [Thermoplasmata archaeon]